jgi:hypothetical protein
MHGFELAWLVQAQVDDMGQRERILATDTM